MATSLVKQATTVAEQFIPRQINTNPQSSLQGLQTGNVYADRTPSKYALLVNSLSNFSSTLEQTKTNELKRNQQEDLDLAKKAIAGETIEGLATRSAVQILADRGLSSLGTGVTEAYIDKQRGRAIVARANQGFQTYMATQELPKTGEEYLDTYNTYVKNVYEGIEKTVTNKTAFDEGYYETFVVNQKVALEDFDKRKLKENREFATGVLDSNTSDLILSYDGNNKEAITSDLKKSLETFKFTAQTDTTTNAKVYNDVLRRYVEAGIFTGEDVKKLTSELVVGNDYYSGEPMYMSKHIGVDNLVNLADKLSSTANTVHNYNITQDAIKLGSPEEFYRYLESIKYSKPLDYKALNAQATQIENQINTRNKQIEAQKNAMAISSWNNQMSSKTLQAALNAELEGKVEYVNTQGISIPISNIQVEERDSKGNLKTRSATVSEKSATVQQYIANLYNTKMDLNERSEKVLKVLSTEIGKGYADSYRQQAVNGFALIKEGKDGKTVIPETVKNVMELRASNTPLFYATMGEAVNAKASALARLTESMGNQEEALKVYARANTVKQDNPDLYNSIKNDMEYNSNSLIIPVTGLNGAQVLVNVASLGQNGLKTSLVETATLIEAGERSGQGLTSATEAFKKNYTAYNKSSMLPKRIFSVIQSDKPLQAGRMVIDSLLKGKSTPEDAVVTYSATQQAIFIDDVKYPLSSLDGIFQKLISGGATVPTGNLDIVNINNTYGQSIVEGDYEGIITRMVD